MRITLCRFGCPCFPALRAASHPVVTCRGARREGGKKFIDRRDLVRYVVWRHVVGWLLGLAVIVAVLFIGPGKGPDLLLVVGLALFVLTPVLYFLARRNLEDRDREDGSSVAHRRSKRDTGGGVVEIEGHAVEGLSVVGKRLSDVYTRLIGEFGPQGWWPAEDGFEMAVGAILTQSTAWTNVEQAIGNLKGAGLLSANGIADAPDALLDALVRPSGYFRVKARKLRAFVAHLVDKHGGRLDSLFHVKLPALREELLSIWGIGPETADSIILYGAGQPVFVVDGYTRRILHRLGLCRADAPYNELQALFTSNLPHSVPLFQEYHALIVALGKRHCRPASPRCPACPLRDLCPWSSSRTGRSSPSASPAEEILGGGEGKAARQTG